MSLKIKLTKEEVAELEYLVKRAAKPYMRSRAKAILLIHQGRSGRWVAHHGLLRRYKKNTIYEWFHHYVEQGVEGLYIKKGRGRKSSFFPSGKRRSPGKARIYTQTLSS